MNDQFVSNLRKFNKNIELTTGFQDMLGMFRFNEHSHSTNEIILITDRNISYAIP